VCEGVIALCARAVAERLLAVIEEIRERSRVWMFNGCVQAALTACR
jgi:hypothetical protein